MLTSAALAAPATLDCSDRHQVNWRAETPELVATSDDPYEELGGMTIHLDPLSGRWFLAVAGSAALTNDGGTFEIVRQGFERYYDEWVGIDQDTMLRIRGGEAPYRFVFLSRDYAVVMGTCVEPDEPFIFLHPGQP